MGIALDNKLEFSMLKQITRFMSSNDISINLDKPTTHHYNLDTNLYNQIEFIKRHDFLDGMISAEDAGILMDGWNKWKTIIENTVLNSVTI